MKDFIQYIPARQKVDQHNLDLFIEKFNKKIRRGDFSINDTLDNLPNINDTEFERLQKQALKNGYLLTKGDDNYQSTSYQLNPLKK